MFGFERKTLNDPSFQDAFKKGTQLISLIKSFEWCNLVVISSYHEKSNSEHSIYFKVYINDAISLYCKGELNRFSDLYKFNRSEYYDKFDENVNRIIRELLIGDSYYKEKLELLKTYTLEDPVDIVIDDFYYDDSKHECSVSITWNWLRLEHGNFFFQQYQGTSEELAQKRRSLLISELNKKCSSISPMCFGTKTTLNNTGTNCQTSYTPQSKNWHTSIANDELTNILNNFFDSSSCNTTPTAPKANHQLSQDKCTICNGTGLMTITMKTLFGTMTKTCICSSCKGSGLSKKSRH